MEFFLGTHQPHWLARTATQLFVSRRRLAGYKTLPRAISRWALDSGGFSELKLHHSWDAVPVAKYIAEVRRFYGEIGNMVWAAPQDWMCEPDIIAGTGLTAHEHVRRTVRNFLELRSAAPDVPWVPVLQGWTFEDYLFCADMYARAGVRLGREPLVGIGTMCRRQHTGEAAAIIRYFASRQGGGLRLHGFGFKMQGLAACKDALASADSMAWSYSARRAPPLVGCVRHINCANCIRYALKWRQRLMDKIEDAA